MRQSEKESTEKVAPIESTVSKRSYPIRPTPEHDSRFTIGLVIDVADVLQRHGFETPHGLDIVDLQQALYRLLYVGDGRQEHGNESGKDPGT